MSSTFGMPISRRYALLEKLGEGGMGEVYRAYDGLAQRVVAFKRVRIGSDISPEATLIGTEADELRLALAQEFHTLATLRHPHIISVLDYGFDEARQPYFTMDYLENADGLLEAGQEQDVERRIGLLVQILQAVAYLHRRGIIHRDLKPGNVLVVNREVKVLDFGLSVMRDQERAAEEGAVGTLAYMAPEVLRGEGATVASDLYAVGVMAYELLAGRHPFNVDNIGALINDILTTSPDLTPLRGYDLTSRLHDSNNFDRFLADLDDQLQRDGLSTAVEEAGAGDRFDSSSGISAFPVVSLTQIVERLLAKDPNARYATAEAVISDIGLSVPFEIPSEGAAIRESYLQAARFVGRDAELRLLEGALAAAEKGSGSVWLVGGESGVGKTRLIDELRIRALVRGFLVLRGQAVAEGGIPYQLWREPVRRLALSMDLSDLDAAILRDLVPDIDLLQGRAIPEAAPLEGAAHHQRLLGTIANLFRRQTQPMVVLLEDLQWSRQSLEILKLICGLVSDLPVFVVGTYRDDERPGLPDELPGTRLLRLGRLDKPDIAALSVSMLGQAGQQPEVLRLLERETEGNVFFLVEVVRALAEEAGSLDRVGQVSLPESVVAGGIESFVRRRLERVPQPDLKLLWLAAIVGRELDLKVLEGLSDRDLESWLVTCNQCGVLDVDGDLWRFSHDKLRQGALSMIPGASRPALHRQVAEAMEAVYGDQPERAAVLAQHWGQAQEWVKERIYLQRAGEHALQISAFESAIRRFKRALDLLEITLQPDEDIRVLRADLLLRLGEALKYTGDYGEARSYLEQALELRLAVGDQSGIALVMLELGDLTIYLGDYGLARRLCEDSLLLYRQLDHQTGTARALDRLGLVLFHQGDYAGAVRYCDEALTLSRALHDQKGIASAINNLGMAAFAQGDYPAASRYFQETLAITQASGERRRAAAALLNLGSAAGAQDDYPTANAHFEQSLEIFRSIGERRGVALALDNLGVIAEYQSDFGRAMAYYEESLELARRIGNRRGVATTLVNLGNVARAQDDDAHAADLYHQGMRDARDIESVPTLLEALVGLAALHSQPAVALEWLGLVINHPAAYEGTRALAGPVIERLKSSLDPETAAQCLERGKALDLQAVIAQILG